MTIEHILPRLAAPTIFLGVRVRVPDRCRAPQFPRHAVAPLCPRAIPLGIAGWPRFGVCSRNLGGGSGNAGTRPERRPRRQDRGGRQDAAPRHPGIGPNAINPSTVSQQPRAHHLPRAIRPRDFSSTLELILPPPYAGPLLATEHSADLPPRRPIRPKSRRGWNSSPRTPT